MAKKHQSVCQSFKRRVLVDHKPHINMKQHSHSSILQIVLFLLWFSNGAYSFCPHKSEFEGLHCQPLQPLQFQKEGIDRSSIVNEDHALVGQGDLIATNMRRRNFLGKWIPLTAGVATTLMRAPNALAADKEDFSSLLSKVKENRSQLDPIPTLIKEEKWDSVRAILITPPLSDCWAKTAKSLLLNYAEQIGELPDGDELAALEYKEEAAVPNPLIKYLYCPSILADKELFY